MAEAGTRLQYLSSGGGGRNTFFFKYFSSSDGVKSHLSPYFFMETRGSSPAEVEWGVWAKLSAGRYLSLLPVLQINLLIAAALTGWVSVLN